MVIFGRCAKLIFPFTRSRGGKKYWYIKILLYICTTSVTAAHLGPARFCTDRAGFFRVLRAINFGIAMRSRCDRAAAAASM